MPKYDLLDEDKPPWDEISERHGVPTVDEISRWNRTQGRDMMRAYMKDRRNPFPPSATQRYNLNIKQRVVMTIVTCLAHHGVKPRCVILNGDTILKLYREEGGNMPTHVEDVPLVSDVEASAPIAFLF